MGNVMDNRCPSCNAPITYKPSLGKFKCDYCDNEFEASDLKTEADSTIEVSETTDNTHYNQYNCPDCGAQIIADENTSATFCLYCGNSSILKNKLSGAFKPDYIIPFKKEKKDAVEAFKGLAKGRPFIPKTFLSEKNIEKITGLYIPFWLYDLKVRGSVNMAATRVRTWSVGDTRHVETKYYDLYRQGTFDFEKVPVDGSTKFNDDIMNSIEPFDYKLLEAYNPAYLSGFLAEKYDIESDKAVDAAIRRVLKSSEEQMLASAVGYNTKNITKNGLAVSDQMSKYALLPVWMVNVKYNNEFYLFAMNGQTGEFIGNIPLDKKKVVIWSILMFVGIFVAILLFFFIFVMGGKL